MKQAKMRRALLGLTTSIMSTSTSAMATAAPKTVIVGGGVTGCCIAYYLAKHGVRSTIIDEVGIAPAASGKVPAVHAPAMHAPAAYTPAVRAPAVHAG